MDGIILYGRPDGGLSRTAPAPKARRMLRNAETGALEPESDESFLAFVAHKDVPVTLTEDVAPSEFYPARAAGSLVDRAAAVRWGWAFSDTPWTACTRADIPEDETFRDAWCLPDGGDPDCVAASPAVACRMSKAREIHMARIRIERDAELLALDVPQVRALALKDDAEVGRLEAEKQKLRDIPQSFDLTAARSPAELKALWPAELEGRRPAAPAAQPKAKRP